MCDAHIAPKKFNEIAFGAEKQLASSAGEVASTVCAEVGGVYSNFSKLFTKPFSHRQTATPSRGSFMLRL